jgi:acyl-CoA synthetase (AMP-forming)/AMP-acid ligase II
VGRQAAEKMRCVVMQGYGMTEASPITNVNPINAPRDGTVGPPVADTLEKVVSLETGEELPPGEIGELLVFGPQVMLGYWNNPDATAETITPDGWLRTGDIASADADGYVRIHDRKKEMIKYKGYQTRRGSRRFMEHPVRDAAVIPSDDDAGEVPKAFASLGPGADLAEIVASVTRTSPRTRRSGTSKLWTRSRRIHPVRSCAASSSSRSGRATLRQARCRPGRAAERSRTCRKTSCMTSGAMASR